MKAWLIAAAAVLSGCAPLVMKAPAGDFSCARQAPRDKTASFAGSWNANFGPLQLTQDGKDVRGDYADHMTGGTGTLSGRVLGNKLNFRWDEGRWAGNGQFELCADRVSFAGSAMGPDGRSYAWSGKMAPGSLPAGEPSPEAGPAPSDTSAPAAAPAEKPWWQQTEGAPSR